MTIDASQYPTVDNRWDTLYHDFPHFYDAFASVPKVPSTLNVLLEMFQFKDKRVADVGSGSGRSVEFFSRYVKFVIGIEPEEAMLAVALDRLARRGTVETNYLFMKGTADSIPLYPNSVDIVTHITAPINVEESLRILCPGGVVVVVGITPGWYGGDLGSIIGHQEFDIEQDQKLIAAGFSYVDVDSVQEYGSTEKILRTYGFIFGRKAIQHLLETGRTSINWKFRIHYRTK